MLSRDGTAWAPTRPANQASSGNTNSILGKRESALGKAESIFIEQSSPRVVSARGDTRPGRTMFRRFSSESLFVEATLRRHPSRCFCGGRTSVRCTLLLAAVPPHRLHVALPNMFPAGASYRLRRMFLCHRLPADGTILAPHIGPAFPQLTRCKVGGHVMQIHNVVEFFQLLQCCEKRQRFPVGCYRPGEIMKLRRILRCQPSSYVRIRREFQDSFDAFASKA